MLARYNPFATDRVERLLTFQPEWSGNTWEELGKKWASQNYRAAITGRHGAGKTCFLNTWATKITDTPQRDPLFIFLNREQPRITGTQWQSLEQCHGRTVILDGEEQLGPYARIKFYRLARTASGILVTRHHQGKLPTLIHLAPDLDMLTRCVKKLAPDHFALLTPLLPAFWQKHKGNIRHCLLECYDQLAVQADVQRQAV